MREKVEPPRDQDLPDVLEDQEFTFNCNRYTLHSSISSSSSSGHFIISILHFIAHSITMTVIKLGTGRKSVPVPVIFCSGPVISPISTGNWIWHKSVLKI